MKSLYQPTEKSKNTGETNGMWKGDKVGITGLHKWVEHQLGRPDECSSCQRKSKVDLANISQQYKRDLNDWEWLCRKCHMQKDGRIDNFIKHHWNYPKSTVKCVNCQTLSTHKARGLCHKCYNKFYFAGKLENYKKTGHLYHE